MAKFFYYLGYFAWLVIIVALMVFIPVIFHIFGWIK